MTQQPCSTSWGKLTLPSRGSPRSGPYFFRKQGELCQPFHSVWGTDWRAEVIVKQREHCLMRFLHGTRMMEKLQQCLLNRRCPKTNSRVTKAAFSGRVCGGVRLAVPHSRAFASKKNREGRKRQNWQSCGRRQQIQILRCFPRVTAASAAGRVLHVRFRLEQKAAVTSEHLSCAFGKNKSGHEVNHIKQTMTLKCRLQMCTEQNHVSTKTFMCMFGTN